MKRVAVLLSVLFIGCASVQHPTPLPSPEPVRTAPAWATSLLALALGQLGDCTTLTWTVTEANGGTVDASGLYTAPPCSGANFTPGTFHVVASGCGKTVTLPVDVAEQITSIAITCARVGSAACCTPPPITLAPGGAAQFFAATNYTCPGHVVYAPSTPPALCTGTASAARAPAATAKVTAKKSAVPVMQRQPVAAKPKL